MNLIDDNIKIIRRPEVYAMAEKRQAVIDEALKVGQELSELSKLAKEDTRGRFRRILDAIMGKSF